MVMLRNHGSQAETFLFWAYWTFFSPLFELAFEHAYFWTVIAIEIRNQNAFFSGGKPFLLVPSDYWSPPLFEWRESTLRNLSWAFSAICFLVHFPCLNLSFISLLCGSRLPFFPLWCSSLRICYAHPYSPLALLQLWREYVAFPFLFLFAIPGPSTPPSTQALIRSPPLFSSVRTIRRPKICLSWSFFEGSPPPQASTQSFP